MNQSPYMTLNEVAAHFRVSETTIRLSRGDFVELKRVSMGRRTMIMRSSVEALDRKLARSAKAASDPVDELNERRRA
jgi:DeoR/GlpR family transcriptional regulator of sugar metabolism